MEYFAGIDVSLEFSSVCYKATLAVGVQDPRRGDLDPQVVGMSGRVQRVQRLAGAMGRDRHERRLAASLKDTGRLSAHRARGSVSRRVSIAHKERVMERQATI
jgi:hypothetical protein